MKSHHPRRERTHSQKVKILRLTTRWSIQVLMNLQLMLRSKRRKSLIRRRSTESAKSMMHQQQLKRAHLKKNGERSRHKTSKTELLKWPPTNPCKISSIKSRQTKMAHFHFTGSMHTKKTMEPTFTCSVKFGNPKLKHLFRAHFRLKGWKGPYSLCPRSRTIRQEAPSAKKRRRCSNKV